MSRRIHVSTTDFKVSQPGYDALTTGSENLIFDAFRGPFNGCLMKGFVTGPAGGGWSGASPTFTYTVAYGRTFATAPKLFYGVYDPATGGFMQRYLMKDINLGYNIQVYGTPSVSSVTFTCIANVSSADGASTSFGLCYFIFQA